MVLAHNNHGDQKEFFLSGYNELLDRIEPEKIICYNKPFPEMQGDIVFVDYERSSWRYMNEEPYAPSEYAKYICGAEPLPEHTSLVVKSGYIMQNIGYPEKGMGNSRGGEWRPSKPDDERFLGKPGDIIKTRYVGKQGGYDRETKIGEDGRAAKERHHTDYPSAKYHTDPHDHEIDWSHGYPKLGPIINYPDGAPEFKSYEVNNMLKVIIQNTPEDNRFKSISDFKWCLNCGGEVVFEYHNKVFGIASKLRRTPTAPIKMLISQICIENSEETEKWCDTADEVLEYVIDGVRLRDMITEVEVIDRTI